jgi:DNA repair photolyase
VRKLPVSNPVGRWDRTAIEYDGGETPDADVEVIDDQSQSIIAKNDSPDVGFDFSVNPYRGCMHACAYCYARPTHEYLSLGAGTDFDRKIVVKRRAPELLREAFEKKSWKGDLVVFSGVTDCYQPLEAQLGLTRGCLEVCALYKNPIGLITKGATVERDIDVLSDLVACARATVSVSLPFFDAENARAMEPYAPSPARRLRIIERLAAAGIPVGVSVSPVIPGLSDEEIPRVLTAARDAGATHAFSVFLRLPGAVAPVFEERVRAAMPLRADKILRRVTEARGGKMYDPRFGERQRGRGEYAQMIETLFKSTAERLGLVSREDWHKELPTTFSRPRAQLSLF